MTRSELVAVRLRGGFEIGLRNQNQRHAERRRGAGNARLSALCRRTSR